MTNVIIELLDKVVKCQEMYRDKKKLQGQGKVRGFLCQVGEN